MSEYCRSVGKSRCHTPGLIVQRLVERPALLANLGQPRLVLLPGSHGRRQIDTARPVLVHVVRVVNILAHLWHIAHCLLIELALPALELVGPLAPSAERPIEVTGHHRAHWPIGFTAQPDPDEVARRGQTALDQLVLLLIERRLGVRTKPRHIQLKQVLIERLGTAVRNLGQQVIEVPLRRHLVNVQHQIAPVAVIQLQRHSRVRQKHKVEVVCLLPQALHLLVGRRVEVGRRLVEDEHWPLLQQCAREAEQLTLARRQVGAALLDGRVEHLVGRGGQLPE